MRQLLRFSAISLTILCSAACGSDTEPATDAGADAGMQDTGGADAGVQDTGGADAQPADNGPVDMGMAAPCAVTGNTCPNYVITGTSVTCDLDNTGGVDLVQDNRLEFGMGPDDALLYRIPETGDYSIWLESESSTNGGCGVSSGTSGQTPHTIASCPAAGTTVDLDGFFTGGPQDMQSFTAGQEIVLFIGCTYWSDAQSGPYQLRIEKR